MMMFRTTYRFLAILSAFAIITLDLSCKKDDSPKTVPIPALSDTTQDQKAPPVKITATRKDLCRIIMKQKRLVNENDKMDDRTTTVITTLLSDGSGERVVANVDSIVKNLETFYYDSVCNFQDYFMIGRNLDYMVFMVGYCDSKTRLLRDNFLKYDLHTKKSNLLISGTDYEYSIYNDAQKKPCNQYVSGFAFLQKENTLFIKKAFSLWAINCQNGQKVKYQRNLSIIGILPISANEAYVTFFYPPDTPNTKPHVGKFNIETQKMETFPATMDSFLLTPNARSEDAKSILIYHKTPFQENGISFDTIYVFNQSFLKQKYFIVNEKEDTFSGTPDPKGKWIIFLSNNTLYRFRISDITDGSTYSIQDLIAKSQCIYQAPNKNEIPYKIEGFFLTSVTE
jgi:hypothetical protein